MYSIPNERAETRIVTAVMLLLSAGLLTLAAAPRLIELGRSWTASSRGEVAETNAVPAPDAAPGPIRALEPAAPDDLPPPAARPPAPAKSDSPGVAVPAPEAQAPAAVAPREAHEPAFVLVVRGLGYTVEPIGPADSALAPATGAAVRLLGPVLVEPATIQWFAYEDPLKLIEEAARLASSDPRLHVFSEPGFVVVYAGEDPTVVDLLETAAEVASSPTPIEL